MTEGRRGQAAAEWLLESLSKRDRAIINDLARVRILTGDQLTRLHFLDLSVSSRDRTRRRVLARLAALDVVTTLDRRIGGVRAGSAGLVYALGVAGQHLVPLLGAPADEHTARRARHPWTPGRLFLRHTLAVSELFVRLVEKGIETGVKLDAFNTEPVSWTPNGLGGWLKPDAYVVLTTEMFEDAWWIEVDRATESLPTLKRKLVMYLDFVERGQLGPDGVIPRVLVTVPDEGRREAIQELLDRLPEPADKLLHVVLADEAAQYLVQVLRE